MKSKFTQKEISKMKDIIIRYKNVSDELMDYIKKAEDIQNKVSILESDLEKIKKEENTFMDKLHKKYGDFNLQEIYETLYK